MKKGLSNTVAFVGLGYVGLSTALCFASRGFKVLGLDVDQHKLDMIGRGVPPIHERGVERLLRSSLRRKTFSVSSSYDALSTSRVIFLTVGTPSTEDGSVDTKYIESASVGIGKHMSTVSGYRVVVVKSTVPPGTTLNLVKPILERESGKKAGPEIGLASNPEFLHEGSAIRETLHPEAIVIGGLEKRSSDALLGLYDSFYGRRAPTILTTPPNAEMMKYAINVGRATQLSFVNTVANLCSRTLGCDYDEVKKGLSAVAKMDKRYLEAGLGYGGSCLPKETRAFASTLRSAGVNDDLIVSALRVNQGQVEETIGLAKSLCGSPTGKHVSLLGLAFKAGTDDIRESVAVELARTLAKMGADVSAYDPVAMENARVVLGSQVRLAKSAMDCIKGSECAFIATAWDEFKRLRPNEYKRLMADPVVVDARRIYNPFDFAKAGVRISVLGTAPVERPAVSRAR